MLSLYLPKFTGTVIFYESLRKSCTELTSFDIFPNIAVTDHTDSNQKYNYNWYSNAHDHEAGVNFFVQDVLIYLIC